MIKFQLSHLEDNVLGLWFRLLRQGSGEDLEKWKSPPLLRLKKENLLDSGTCLLSYEKFFSTLDLQPLHWGGGYWGRGCFPPLEVSRFLPSQTKYIQYSCVNIRRFDLEYLDLKYLVTEPFSLVIRVRPHDFYSRLLQYIKDSEILLSHFSYTLVLNQTQFNVRVTFSIILFSNSITKLTARFIIY